MTDLGSNPVLLEVKFQFTPHPWLTSIENGHKQLEEEYLQVSTQPERIQKAAFAAINTTWLGRRDSNPRMPVPKTGALPLGHAPIRSYDFNVDNARAQHWSYEVASAAILRYDNNKELWQTNATSNRRIIFTPLTSTD